MRLPRVTGRDQRGQSAIDILVGLALSVLLGAMIVQLMRVARYEVDQRVRSIQQTTVRVGMDRVMADLRNSRPLGECASQPGASMGTCRRVRERPFSLATEATKPSTATQTCFYAQRENDPDPLVVPDLVCVKVSGSQLVVETTQGAGTYTNPSWPGAASSRGIGKIDPAVTRFTYYVQGATGTPTAATLVAGPTPGDPPRLSAADLRNVVFVEATVGAIDPSLVNKKVSTQLTFQAALRGSRLQREQNAQELRP